MKLNGTFKKVQICDHSESLKCLYSKKKMLKQLNGKDCNDIKIKCDLCYRYVNTRGSYKQQLYTGRYLEQKQL
jgi:hypothetical protein